MKKQMIYATMYLGDGAAGSQTMFTVPLGQTMPAMMGPDQRCAHCGRFEIAPTQTTEHTNICQAGQFGSAIGDVALFSMKAKTSDGKEQRSDIDHLSYEVRVSGQRVAGGALHELLGEPVSLPRVLVSRHDTFEVEIAIPSGMRLKCPSKAEPLFLKVEFWAEVVAQGEEL